MSSLELREAVEQMTPVERVALKHFLIRNFPDDEVVYSATFDQRMAEMDAGKKVAWEEVRAMLEQQTKLPG